MHLLAAASSDGEGHPLPREVDAHALALNVIGYPGIQLSIVLDEVSWQIR
jgi:hypothetical protein